MASTARVFAALLPVWAVAMSGHAVAGPFSRVETTSAVTTIDAKQLGVVRAICPDDLKVISAVVTPANTRGTFVVAQDLLLVDGTRIGVDGASPAPSGISSTLYNSLDANDVANIEVLCGRPSAGVMGLAMGSTVNIAAQATERAVTQCGPGYMATWGGYTTTNVAVRASYPHFGESPHYLDQLADGAYAGPVGWENYAYNPGTGTQSLFNVAVCWQLPDAVAQVGSVALSAGEFRFVGLAVSEQRNILGGGVSGGSEGYWRGSARWTLGLGTNYSRAGWDFKRFADGTGTTGAVAQWRPKAGEIPLRSGGLLGSFVQDLRAAGSAAPASPVKVAIITIPAETAAPATSVVSVVEYYNAARDHWFMTSIPQEIADLDAGVHAGWVRTGYAFNAYATGSGGPLGRLPFCRYYGLPEFGLDSHFYTGSILECLEILAKFRGAWQLESGEVFQVQLPNVQTGACPAGTVAVFRTWNGRTDSNHRYITDPAVRAQMIAAGHVAEGYGPMGVAFCAVA